MCSVHVGGVGGHPREGLQVGLSAWPEPRFYRRESLKDAQKWKSLNEGICIAGPREPRVVCDRKEEGVEWVPAVTLGLIFEDGGCVAPAECPCEFHGTLHPPGAVVKEDCNTWSVPSAGAARGTAAGAAPVWEP